MDLSGNQTNFLSGLLGTSSGSLVTGKYRTWPESRLIHHVTNMFCQFNESMRTGDKFSDMSPYERMGFYTHTAYDLKLCSQCYEEF